MAWVGQEFVCFDEKVRGWHCQLRKAHIADDVLVTCFVVGGEGGGLFLEP